MSVHELVDAALPVGVVLVTAWALGSAVVWAVRRYVPRRFLQHRRRVALLLGCYALGGLALLVLFPPRASEVPRIAVVVAGSTVLAWVVAIAWGFVPTVLRAVVGAVRSRRRYESDPEARQARGRAASRIMVALGPEGLERAGAWTENAGPLEFERRYAAWSTTTVAELRKQGGIVVPCDCGDDICEGWAVVPADLLNDYKQMGRVPASWQWPPEENR